VTITKIESTFTLNKTYSQFFQNCLETLQNKPVIAAQDPNYNKCSIAVMTKGN